MTSFPLKRTVTLPHSRGRVICDACYSPIPQGQQYRRDTWKDGTHHFTIRYCPDCWLILDEVEAHTQPDYGGPDAEDYETWAAAHIDEERSQKWITRAFPDS